MSGIEATLAIRAREKESGGHVMRSGQISHLRVCDARQENEQRLSFYVDNSPMATIEWDADFIVTRWAGEAENVFGWTPAETIGKPIMDLRMIYEEDLRGRVIINKTT